MYYSLIWSPYAIPVTKVIVVFTFRRHQEPQAPHCPPPCSACRSGPRAPPLQEVNLFVNFALLHVTFLGNLFWRACLHSLHHPVSQTHLGDALPVTRCWHCAQPEDWTIQNMSENYNCPLLHFFLLLPSGVTNHYDCQCISFSECSTSFKIF